MDRRFNATVTLEARARHRSQTPGHPPGKIALQGRAMAGPGREICTKRAGHRDARRTRIDRVAGSDGAGWFQPETLFEIWVGVMKHQMAGPLRRGQGGARIGLGGIEGRGFGRAQHIAKGRRAGADDQIGFCDACHDLCGKRLHSGDVGGHTRCLGRRGHGKRQRRDKRGKPDADHDSDITS
ncbi:hypothetical protein [Roseovarius sp. TE539]|uniref:hypothetical protein n=1 Tax=Roseovarius sp. TE539 TaxID=2249812 RepID=UPI0015EEA91B|nr:hypothetical protein [Roseovarius sp. TE539]